MKKLKPMRNALILLLPLTLMLFAGLPGDETPPTTPPLPPSAPDVRLPLKTGSVRWAVIGDNGTGLGPEREIADEMQHYWTKVHFDFVTMDGDNIYGSHTPEDFTVKFEQPYEPLLEEGVQFYASLGNHDQATIEDHYKPFNMGGNRYYTFQKESVEFFVLDSNSMTRAQLSWLENKLKTSTAHWKIAYFHHPLYTCATYHGPAVALRNELMPLFRKYGLNAVWSGHEHVYERLKPQEGIYFFIEGESGQLRYRNIDSSCELDAARFDTDRSFMLVEVDGKEMYFETVSRSGAVVDSGQLALRNEDLK